MSDDDHDALDHMVQFVLRGQSSSYQRGALSMWTIYDHPPDRPRSIVARKHEVAKGVDSPTDEMLEVIGGAGGLAVLREVFERAGLTCLTRSPGDKPSIVETWL